MAEARVELPGSRRLRVHGARLGKEVDTSERITVLVVVKPKSQPPKTPSHRQILSRDEYLRRYGADPAHLAQIRAFAREHNLQVVAESAAKRSVELAGTVADMKRAFGVTLRHGRIEGRAFRHRVGGITLPRSVAPSVVAVLGLDNRPQAEPRYQSRPQGAAGPRATAGALTPIQVANLYNFPPGDGTGQTIAVIELGGGFSQSDLTTYFTGLGVPVPSVTPVTSDGWNE
jgi:kumamolisin